MKILMIDCFLPNSIYTVELCDKLSKNNELIMLSRDNYLGGNRDYIIKPIIHSKSKNLFQAFKLFIKDQKNILKIVEDFKPDVVHFQGVQHPLIEKHYIKKIKKHSKVFFTAHNILSHEKKKFEKQALEKYYKNFDGIIVHNETSKKTFLEHFNYNGDITVIPHGSYDVYAGSNLEIKKRKNDKINFLQFGLIREYKGVDILLHAISMLPNDIKEKVKFTIAGFLNRHRYDYDIEKVINDLEIQNIVNLKLQRIEDDEIPELFNSCDCCIFPYRHIYGSGALLMAYTFQKPVIVSEIPTFVEETNNGATGLIFKHLDASSLSQAIIDFCNKNSEEIKVYKENIQELVRKKYNWINSAKLLEAAYKEKVKCYENV